MSIKGLGVTLAEAVVTFIGSWTFIILQTLMVTAWIIINIVSYVHHYDPYPFILLNLFLSFQAAYATPMILMSSNVQAEKDRKKTDKDLALDEESNKILKLLMKDLKIDEQSLLDHKISKTQHQELKEIMIILEKKIDAVLNK